MDEGPSPLANTPAPAARRVGSPHDRLRWSLGAVCVVGALLGAAAGTIGAADAPSPTVRVVVGTGDGGPMEAFVSGPEYRGFLDRAQSRVDLRRQAARARVASAIDRELSAISRDMAKGVESYSDWYFTWGTTHSVVFTAARAYAGAIGSAETSPRAAAASAMNKIFEDKFIELVLRPEVTLPRLEAALQRIAASEREALRSVIAEEVGTRQRFIRESGAGRRPGAVSMVVDWSAGPPEVEARLLQTGNGASSPGLPSTEAVDFSDLIRTALIQSAVNNLAGFTTSLATPTLTVLDSGATVSAALTSVLGPFAPFFTPEMLIAGTGIAMATDYAMVKAAEYGGRDELMKSAKDSLGSVRLGLSRLFHQELDRYSDRLYAELAEALSKKG